MNLSKQDNMQRIHPIRHLVQPLPPVAASILLPTYSNIALINHIIANTHDPKASDPGWYLIDHQKPFHTEESPGIPSASAISFFEKYQVHVATITTNSLHDTMKAVNQKIANDITQSMAFVYSDQVTSFSWEGGFDALTPSSEIEHTFTIAKPQVVNTNTPSKKYPTGTRMIRLVSANHSQAVSITAIDTLS